MIRALSLAALVLLVTTTGAQQPKSFTAEEVKAADKRLTEYLEGLKGPEAARVTPLTADGVAATFPDHVLFGVIFRQYPIAQLPPAPLKPANVIAVPKKKDGKPVPITDLKALEMFFKSSARAVKGSTEGEAAIGAWLRCAAELNQDGFYRFTVKVDEKARGNEKDFYSGSGAAPVEPNGGNKGDVRATLTFKDGKLAEADTKVMLTPGPRPICQATKLLDPDPIVRRMAEDAIRVMGSAAKPYLDEQRARAKPELKAAIDRIWERIQKEGR